MTAGRGLTKNLAGFVARERRDIESSLREWLPESSLSGAGRLNGALEYAVFPGGKRLRPALALLASALAGATRAQGLRVACAVEFLHSSSLILDDLPAMDDANLRRSRRALHLVYGEGVAVLAAVALLNRSYALLAEAARAGGDGAVASVASLVEEVTRCVGSDGMVGGQFLDLETRAGVGNGRGAEALARRDLKTVALMRLMMTAGALACGSRGADVVALAEFGDCLGRAYQICDDLLDEACAAEVTGKPARQDARNARATAVTTLGVEGARRCAEELIERGVARISERFGGRFEARLLAEAARSVLLRAGAARAAAGRVA